MHSHRHNATHRTPSPLIPTAQRYPDDALPANPNGTAPPRPRSPRQSQRHSATQTTLSLPIPTAQRYPYQALPTNHNGTALPTPRSPCQSQRHTASDATRPPAIPTAQRIGHDTPTTNPHGTATQSYAQATPVQANPKGTAHRAQNERARSCANARDIIFKMETNTVPPPDPPVKNKNLSLRIRDKRHGANKFKDRKRCNTVFRISWVTLCDY